MNSCIQVNGLFDGRDGDTIEWSDLAKLPYLTRCIKESLRLHSPVPATVRLLEEDLEIDGKVRNNMEHLFCRVVFV